MSDIETDVVGIRLSLIRCEQKCSRNVRIINAICNAYKSSSNADIQSQLIVLNKTAQILENIKATINRMKDTLNQHADTITQEQVERFKSIVEDKLTIPLQKIDDLMREFTSILNIDIDDFE